MNRTATASPHSTQRPAQALYLVTSLQVKVTGLGVETQVNAIPIVSDDVLGPWVLAVPPAD